MAKKPSVPNSDATTADLGAWRKDRAKHWYRDIGYTFQEIIQSHRYDYLDKGSKPQDPGWHMCSCRTWEGYWSGYEPHVANHLRNAVIPVVPIQPEPIETGSAG